MVDLPLFYTPDLQGDYYRLNEEESKHCVRVLRLGAGDRLQLTDGRGLFCEAVITSAHPKGCELEIIERKEEVGKRPFSVTIALAPTKNNERTEWFLEKGTEIGLEVIIPLLCRHSERREIKAERFEKVMVAAMKQSVKAYLPVLEPLQSIMSCLKRPFAGQKFIAHCHSGSKPLLRDLVQRGQEVVVLIGPEGDFSLEEVDQAIKAGFVAVSLGESRLRTETAALVACHTVNLINQ